VSDCDFEIVKLISKKQKNLCLNQEKKFGNKALKANKQRYTNKYTDCQKTYHLFAIKSPTSIQLFPSNPTVADKFYSNLFTFVKMQIDDDLSKRKVSLIRIDYIK